MVWVGFADGNIEVFDSESRESLGVVPRHHSGGVYCLAHFGNTVFSGSNDFQIGMWDACTRGYLRQFSGHTNYVRCLHAEGALLFSGGDDGTVRVWNTTNGSEISRATFHRKAGVGCLIRVGPDMWSGDNSGDIIVWRLQTMREEHLLKEHTGRITALKKVGRSRVYSAAADRLICVWDAFTHTLLHRVAEHNAWVLSLAFPCSLTRHYVWTGAADATVRCFHHDEFVPMTHALETALEGGWYACDYAPYRDLADAQGEELRAARDKLKLLFDSERQARERAGHLEMHLDRARAEITEVDTRNHREMEEVALLKRRFADFDRREHELLRQVDAAQQQREEMRQRLEATEAENARLADAVRAANERVDAARVQSDHMEEILKEAVRAQTEARMQAMGAATGDARGPLGSPRGGGGGAVRKAQSPRDGAATPGLNRAASFSASGIGGAGSKYFGGKERPLILVTMGPEYQKVVTDFEAEIKELNEKIARLQRVQTAGIRKAGSGGALRPPSAGAQNQANNAAANPARDWSSQAADILKSRQSQKDLFAMASGQFVPRPPPNNNNNGADAAAGAAAASSAIFGATVPEW